MKRLLGGVAAAALTLSLVACGGSGDSDPEESILTGVPAPEESILTGVPAPE